MTVKKEAIESSESQGASIKESGAYVGKFEMVTLVTYESGAQAVKFEFKASDERKAFFNIFVTDKSGNETFGAGIVQSLAYLFGLKEFDYVRKMADVYDYTAKSNIVKELDVFDCFLNKIVGIIVQKELSIYNGELKEKLNLLGFYDSSTMLTANEMMQKKAAPKFVQQKMAWLEQNPVKDKRGVTPATPATPAPPAARGASQQAYQADDLDDDIPF